MRGKWLNTCFQLSCGSSELSFHALVEALAGQDGDASQTDQIRQLLLLTLLNDTNFATYPVSNIHIFKHVHFQNLFTVNNLHLDVVTCLFKKGIAALGFS